MPHSMKALAIAMAIAAVAAGPAAGQLTKPRSPSLTPIVGPSSLTATGGPTSILLVFPGVSGASGYRVTRTNNAGDPETTVFEGTLDRFAFNGAACSPSQGCAWTDVNVARGYLYSYRVYSLFPNPSGPPIVSPPSPVASAQLKFARLP